MDVRTLHDAATIADPLERARVLTMLITENQSLVDEAARYRRSAIVEAREQGVSRERVAIALGVTPPRISQMTRTGTVMTAPMPPESAEPRVLVQRALPTPPAVRGSPGLFLAEAQSQGIRADRRMLSIGLEPSPADVAAVLRVEPGEEVVARRKLMLANDVPVRIATSYFRADLFAGTRMSEPEFVRPSLQAALSDLGYAFGRAEETLLARPPSLFERENLELDSGEWVVQVLRIGYSTDDTPVHALETICAASRHLFPIGQVAGTDVF
ncbi:MAG: GntR family transcriptional regulator [Nocardioides sp.]